MNIGIRLYWHNNQHPQSEESDRHWKVRGFSVKQMIFEPSLHLAMEKEEIFNVVKAWRKKNPWLKKYGKW